MAATTADPVILYDASVSSYCQKIRIALREKGISFKLVVPESIKTGKSDPEFQGLNPRLEVPTLVDGDVKVFDSTIIMEYLEDKWPASKMLYTYESPEPRLLPKDPASRAKARMTEEVCDTQYEALNWGMGEITWFNRAVGDLAEKLKAEAASQTKTLQRWLTERLGHSKYFNGESFGWADICVAPIVNRSVHYGLGPSEDSALALWLARIKERESVRATFAEFEAAVVNMPKMAGLFKTGERKREYRDHRLEWLVKSGGIDVVSEGLKADNIRFSWP